MRKTSLHARATDTVIITTGAALDANWQTGGATHSTPDALAVVKTDHAERVVRTVEAAMNGGWVTATPFGVVAQIPNAQRSFIDERIRAAAGDGAEIAIHDLTHQSHSTLAAHARSGGGMTEARGIIRLDPGQWTVEASEDGRTVTLTKA